MTKRRYVTIRCGALLAALSATALTPIAVRAADTVLTGTIRAADGSALGGVMVSARFDGSNVVTSVFTDESGNYYFPPMATGKYQVWAQAITFDIGRGNLDLGRRTSAGFHPEAAQGLRTPTAG